MGGQIGGQRNGGDGGTEKGVNREREGRTEGWKDTKEGWKGAPCSPSSPGHNY